MKRRPTQQVRKVQRRLHLEFIRKECASSSSSQCDSTDQSDGEQQHHAAAEAEEGYFEGYLEGYGEEHQDQAGAADLPNHASSGDDNSNDFENDNAGDVYFVVPPEPEHGPVEDLVDNNVERFRYISENLKKWAKRGVAFTKVDELLKMLRPIYPYLSKSYRTLLETPRDLELETIGDHEVWYKGITANLQQRIQDDFFINNNSIKIDVFIDSFQPFKSSPYSFWAILGCLVTEKEPFIIQISRGDGHPPLVEFFQKFIDEVNNLQQNGFLIQGGRCPFEIRSYFADAVGRAFIKRIVGHTGHHACERCNIVGHRYHTYYEVFVGPNGRPRSDQSFAERRDALHHVGVSPLEALGVNMVSQIPLDGLHLVDEGCMRRWLKQVWGKYRFKRGAIGPWRKRIVQRLVGRVRRCIPSEFNRRTRSFWHLSYFKAAEFRRILLYDGVRLFRNFEHNVYLNFLQLHCAITILSNPEHIQSEIMLQIADRLLARFVDHARRIFGTHFLVYNIHSIKHLVEECRKHGIVIDFSTYKFEDFFAILKRVLRSGNCPIQQLRNRDIERAGHFQRCQKEKIEEGQVELLQRESIQYNEEGITYKKIKCTDFSLGTSRRDCCFLSHNKEVVCITKIIYMHNGKVALKGHQFAVLGDYYLQPIPSSMLDIYAVSRLIGREETWYIENVKKKCMLLPDRADGDFVCLPLVH